MCIYSSESNIDITKYNSRKLVFIDLYVPLRLCSVSLVLYIRLYDRFLYHHKINTRNIKKNTFINSRIKHSTKTYIL